MYFPEPDDSTEKQRKLAYYFSEALDALRDHHDEKALRFLDLVIELEPDYGYAHGMRGNIYMQLGQFEKAIEELEKQRALTPHDFWEFSLDYADTLQALQRHKEAIKAYHNFIKYFAWSRTGYIQRAKSYFFLDQHTKCIRDIKHALKMRRRERTHDPSCYYFLGASYFHSGKYDEALHYLAKAVRLHPENALAYYYRGIIFFTRKQWKRSIDSLSRAEWFSETLAKEAALFRFLARLMTGDKHATKNDLQKLEATMPGIKMLLKNRQKVSLTINRTRTTEKFNIVVRELPPRAKRTPDRTKKR